MSRHIATDYTIEDGTYAYYALQVEKDGKWCFTHDSLCMGPDLFSKGSYSYRVNHPSYPLSSNCECWMRTARHGTFSKEAGLMALAAAITYNEDRRFRLVKVTLTQKCEVIVE